MIFFGRMFPRSTDSGAPQRLAGIYGGYISFAADSTKTRSVGFACSRIQSHSTVKFGPRSHPTVLHPHAVRMRRNSCDFNPASLQVYHDQHEDRHQTLQSPDFGCREVNRCNRIPVRLQKRFPRRFPLPLRHGLDAIRFQDVSDGLAADRVSDVGRGTLHAVVSPRANFKTRSTISSPTAVRPTAGFRLSE